MPEEVFVSVNPATEARIGEFHPDSPETIEARLRAASQAFRMWRELAIQERCGLLLQLGKQLQEAAGESARLMTQEMGKPLAQAEAEIQKCARLCAYYAAQGPQFLSPRHVAVNDAARAYVRFDPLGAVLAVMPWNFPFWQVFRFAIPTLLAGNVAVLKHATNVLGCAVAIERLFDGAGFPEGVFTSLVAGHARLPGLIADPVIQAVTLTGSEGAGRSVGESAGKQLKKCVLELGGSDPFLVLPDADLPLTIEKAVQSRTLNNGQSCIAAKRFIVHADVYEPFVEGFTERMQSLVVGDPEDPRTQVGPLARRDLRETLHQQVRATIQAGAQLCTGGRPLDRRGWFYKPTVLSDVTPEMAAFREETFGPVAAVVRAANLEQAVDLANQSSYGLGASLWTRDRDLAETLATRIDAGCVFINEFTKSDPTVPFGGVKNSGFGRELGEFGIHEFVNIKTVWIGL